ncbi:MAG: hypothetical protein GVY30_11825 [Chloroflexi bacterium]|nr:hypothetical protein [Chloroflexota bacterium]
MKKREKQGDVWYSHRVIAPDTGEELYCRGYPSKSGPGYEVQVGPTADGELSAPSSGRRSVGHSAQEPQASSSAPPKTAQAQSKSAAKSPTESPSAPVRDSVGPTRFWKRVNQKTSAGEIPPGVVVRKADVVKSAMKSGDFSAALTWLEAEYA